MPETPDMAEGPSIPRRVAIVEPACVGHQHESINAALVLAARRAFPEARIELYCDPTHFEALRGVWARADHAAPKLEYVPHEAAGPGAARRRLGLARSLRLGRDDFGIATIQDYAFIAGTALAGGGRWAVVEHGALASFEERGFKAAIKNALKSFALFTIGRRCRYILLGGSIARIADEALPSRKDRLFESPLPYLFRPAGPAPERRPGEKVRIVQMGGAHRFSDTIMFEIEAALRERGLENRAELVLHGIFPAENFAPPSGSGVLVSYKTGLIDAAERDAVMAGADYLLFDPPPANYRLMASGAIFDALSFGVPALALSNPYFAWVDEIAGGIGALAPDRAALVRAAVEAVAGYDRSAWLAARERMLSGRERLGLAALEVRLQEIQVKIRN